ncbi:MAG: hypothetical protein KAW01_09020 [Deltaproteobacteria bacterium]|nr:hypothetical protein [Deltaproteobacteria bacterium]
MRLAKEEKGNGKGRLGRRLPPVRLLADGRERFSMLRLILPCRRVLNGYMLSGDVLPGWLIGSIRR